jgi:DNA transformation protein
MIRNLRNLGPQSEKLLTAAGIKTALQLRALGSAAAFVAVKRAGGAPSLNLLWAMEGALTDRDWKDVAKNDRLSLLTQVEMLEQAQPCVKQPYADKPKR